MKKVIGFTLIISLSVCTLSAQGILDRLEKKAKDKVNKRIDQKADEKMDKELDKAFESDNSSDSLSDSVRSTNMARFFIGNRFNACTPKNHYAFSSKATLDIYSQGKDKDDSFSMRYYWFSNSDYSHMGMEFIPLSENMSNMKGTKSIMDLKDSCIITLMHQDGNKMMMTTKYGETDYSRYTDTSEQKVPIKTGKTKKINGKLCHEYILDDVETYQQMWVESSKTTIWDQNLKNWTAKADPYKNGAEFGPFFDYFPLEIMTKDKKSGTITTIFMRSVIKENNSLSTTGYSQF